MIAPPRPEDILLTHFDRRLETFGDTARGADWPNERDRRTRFDVMLDLLPPERSSPVALCDFGCGTGELLAHIRRRGLENIAYVGVDRSALAISYARAKFPDAAFFTLDIADPEAEARVLDCDYLVSNGLFTVKREMPHEAMWGFLEGTLAKLWPRVRRGLAFNVMSKAVDWERDDLFHVPMDRLAELLHTLAGRRVAFRADYGLYEYTAFCFKDPLPAQTSPRLASAPTPTPIIDPIPVQRPRLPRAAALLPYLHRIDRQRTYTNFGPLSRELEAAVAGRLRLPPGAVACASSGTSALMGAILGAAGAADAARPLALLPAFTFAATAAAVERCGYRPYLLDVDPQSWMLDPDALLSHLALPRAGLIVPVGPFGRPVAQDGWRRFASRTGVPVVIDAAASFEHLTASPGEYLGDIPVAVSFHATKTFSSGEGGGIVCGDKAIVERSTQALNFGFLDSRDSAWPSFNGKMSEYHAAVGLAALDELDDALTALRAVASCYRNVFSEHGLGARLVAAPTIGSNTILLECEDLAEAVDVRAALARKGVGFRLWYGPGLHGAAHFRSSSRDDLPVTDDLAPRLIGLPMAEDLSRDAVGRVAAAVVAGLARSGRSTPEPAAARSEPADMGGVAPSATA